MADHMYKLSEVPKGKRLEHFREYYMFKTVIWIVLIVSIISLLKTVFFAAKPDVKIMVATNEFLPQEIWADLQTEMTSFCSDYNEDGKSLIEMNVNTFDNSTKANAQQNTVATQRYMAVLAMAEHLIQIVDEEHYEDLKNQGLIGTYKDLADYNTFKDESEEVKIPLSSIGAFKDITDNMVNEHYLTIRTREGSQLGDKKKKIKNYDNHVEVFARLAYFEK